MIEQPFTSRISGFHQEPIARRLAILADLGAVSDEARHHLSNLPELVQLDRMSENVIGGQVLPFSVALNFRVNQRDVLIPMAVEEPSIVAAASNAARMVRLSGGFVGQADPPVMTAQVQLDAVPEIEAAKAKIEAHTHELVRMANDAIPKMVERGGGCEGIEVRIVDAPSGLLVVHFYVNVGDAMGANLVDTVAESVALRIQELVGGELGLRILSNLPVRRMVRVEAQVSAEALGGEALADGVARASRFASLDPFRAVTHNKGVMNAIDAAAVALGQDWRSIEAGAHAFAAISGQYRPIATWDRTEGGLLGKLQMPLAVATVGGSTRAHSGIVAAFELVRTRSARELAVILGAAGLACNLAALRALAGEGIQKGHMRLHHRKTESEALTREAGER